MLNLGQNYQESQQPKSYRQKKHQGTHLKRSYLSVAAVMSAIETLGVAMPTIEALGAVVIVENQPYVTRLP